jgi:tetratricopeptide (TPR) repeat protein
MGWPDKSTPLYSSSMPVVLCLLALLLSTSSAFSSSSPKTFAEIAKQAEVARQQEHLNDAITLYREGLRLRSSWQEGWWWLGSLLYEQDRFPEAEDAFHQFVAIAPKPGPGYAFLALCEYETEHYDKALQHFRLWARKGWGGTPQLIDVAVFHFALLLTRDGDFVQSLYLLGTEASKSHAPALREAMGLASLRLRNLPEDYPPECREMVWMAGSAAMEVSSRPQRLDRANNYLSRLLKDYGKQPNVHYMAGVLFGFESRPDDAEREFRQELEVSPQHVPAMLELAHLYLRNENAAGAEPLAKQALQVEPGNAEAHHMLGRVLFLQRDFSLSVKELETAKRLSPESGQIRFHLAAAYRKAGRPRDAHREQTAFESLSKKEEVLAPLEPHAEVGRQSP